MKRVTLSFVFILILAGCATQTQQQAAGTMLGMQLGSMVGGAVGSVSSRSARGHFLGTAIGAVTGAALGNAVNAPKRASAEEGRETAASSDKVERRRADIEQRIQSASRPTGVKVGNAVFTADDGTAVLSAGGYGHFSFDIINDGASAVDIYPLVKCSNRNVEISQMTAIEDLAAGDGVRYTVTLFGSNRLKDGSSELTISLSVDGGTYMFLHKQIILTKRR